MTSPNTRTVVMNGSAIDMTRSPDGSWSNHNVRPADRPMRALAFEQLPQDQALKQHPELRGAFAELTQKSGAIERQNLAPDAARKQVAAVRADLQHRLDVGRIPPLPPVTRGPVTLQNRDR